METSIGPAGLLWNEAQAQGGEGGLRMGRKDRALGRLKVPVPMSTHTDMRPSPGILRRLGYAYHTRTLRYWSFVLLPVLPRPSQHGDGWSA
jgi:hypothetical protein